MSTELTNPNVAKLMQAQDRINEFTNTIQNLVVNSNESLAMAKDYAKQAKNIADFITDKRKELTKPLDDEKKVCMNIEKQLTDNLNNVTKDLRSQILGYEQELERQRKEAVRKAEEERKRIEQERLAMEAEARKAAEEGKQVSIEQASAIDEMKKQEAQIAKSTPPPSKSIRLVWTFGVVDLSLVPHQFLQVNEAAVKQAIGSGVREIPGLKICQKEELYLR